MDMVKRKLQVLVVVVLLGTVSALGNSDNRHWTLTSGESFEAELVNYDAKADVATLHPAGGESKTYKLKDFSMTDAAWLLEWVEFSTELDKLAAHMKGEFKHYQFSGSRHTADFYVYTPSKYKEATKLPMLFLFHPSANRGARYVKQFMDAAENLGVIVVSSDAFHNTPNDEGSADMHDCFKELFPLLEKTVAHDPNRLLLGGTSGGAQMAYEVSGELIRPWLGIFANGGWLGPTKGNKWAFASGMRIAMVNGNSDRAAECWIKRDTAMLLRKDCMINLFVFEGGHQVPPPMTQFKALQWLLAEETGNPDDQPVGGLIPLPTGNPPPVVPPDSK